MEGRLRGLYQRLVIIRSRIWQSITIAKSNYYKTYLCSSDGDNWPKDEIDRGLSLPDVLLYRLHAFAGHGLLRERPDEIIDVYGDACSCLANYGYVSIPGNPFDF